MRFVVIVDGYSTGGQYAGILTDENYLCLHLQSSPDLPEFISRELESERYFDCKIHEKLSETLAWIKNYGIPEFILPGSDSGVFLADKLSHELDLSKKNPLHLSLSRRDKFLMGQAIKNYGLRSIKQTKVNNINDASKWMEKNNVSWPVVVKPLRSGSAEGFKLCYTFQSFETAFTSLLYSKDLFNQVNEEILVQEYICGTEYVVNTVSSQGKHVVSEYCIYDKFIDSEGNSLYKSARFLPRNFEHHLVLQEYVFDVLNALEIQYGPSHVEIMIDSNGPVLIEIGARPAGGNMDSSLLRNSYGHSQVDLSVLSYIAPENFSTITNTLNNDLNEELIMMFLLSNQSGIIQEINLDKITMLPSFKKINLHFKVGDHVKKALNLEDMFGIVYLQHKEKNVISSDVKYLENINANECIIVT